jgi:hypothetical protein
MTIPDSQKLMLPVLQALGDGLNHSSGEIRGHASVGIPPHELLLKNNTGKTLFNSNVDLALAYLQGGLYRRSKCIEKVRKGVYRITEYGKAILKRNPSSLTVKDL